MKTAAGTVYENLRRAIVSGRIKPGATLSRKVLAEAHHTSKMPVGHALVRLEAEGLVTVRPRSGTQATPIRLIAVHRAQFARNALEVGVVRRLAARPEQLDLTALRAATLSTPENYAADDERFHRELFAAVGMAGLTANAPGLFVPLERCRALQVIDDARIQRAIGEHADILARIEAADADGAAMAISAHLASDLSDLGVLQRTYPEMFSDD